MRARVGERFAELLEFDVALGEGDFQRALAGKLEKLAQLDIAVKLAGGDPTFADVFDAGSDGEFRIRQGFRGRDAAFGMDRRRFPSTASRPSGNLGR